MNFSKTWKSPENPKKRPFFAVFPWVFFRFPKSDFSQFPKKSRGKRRRMISSILAALASNFAFFVKNHQKTSKNVKKRRFLAISGNWSEMSVFHEKTGKCTFEIPISEKPDILEAGGAKNANSGNPKIPLFWGPLSVHVHSEENRSFWDTLFSLIDHFLIPSLVFTPLRGGGCSVFFFAFFALWTYGMAKSEKTEKKVHIFGKVVFWGGVCTKKTPSENRFFAIFRKITNFHQNLLFFYPFLWAPPVFAKNRNSVF